MLLVIAIICLGGAAFVVGELMTLPARERARFIERTANYGKQDAPSLTPTQGSLRERALAPFVERLARVVLRINPKSSIETVSYRLVSAGLSRSISPTGFLASKAGLAVILGLFGFVTASSVKSSLSILIAVAMPICGFILPDFYLNSRLKARQEQISAQLPDALDLLAVSVEAGLGFDGAVSKLTESLQGPLIDEFNLALTEMRVGEARPEALRKLAERAGVPEISAFTRALIQADTLGISLGRILRVQAADTRERRQQIAEEKAMKAPIKMLFPTVIFIFPSMFIVTIGPAMLQLKGIFG